MAEDYDAANASIGQAHRQRFIRGLEYFSCPGDARVLNIWSRIGGAVPYLRKRFPNGRLVHCEVSGRMIEMARGRFPDEDFRQTDLLHLPFDDRSFDAVLSLETLEHAPDPFGFLCELHRVLKPSGELVLSCPSAAAEPLLRVYELFRHNHGEGPHRFPWSWCVKAMLRDAGFRLIDHRGTVFLPFASDAWAGINRVLERTLGRTPIGEIGIRQFYYGRSKR